MVEKQDSFADTPVAIFSHWIFVLFSKSGNALSSYGNWGGKFWNISTKTRVFFAHLYNTFSTAMSLSKVVLLNLLCGIIETTLRSVKAVLLWKPAMTVSSLASRRRLFAYFILRAKCLHLAQEEKENKRKVLMENINLI